MKFLILCILSIVFLQVEANIFDTIGKKYEDLDIRDYAIISNETYFIGPKNLFLNAVDATRACNDLGMKLVSFENEDKWLDISQYLTENGYADQFGFWSSGRYLSSQIWLWTSSGQEFTFTDWLAKEPNMYNKYENICVGFTIAEFWAGWGDDFCTYTFRLLCEF